MHIVKRTGHPNWVMRDYYSILGFTVCPYWGLQFPAEGHTIIYTCLHVIYKPQYTIIKIFIKTKC